MAHELPHAAVASGASELARCVGHIAERLEAGESIDLDELCADCPEHREQLEMLLPTLQAVVDLNASLGPADAAEPAGRPSAANELTGCLGDFRILRELGRGGMGVVYEAEQLSLGRRVALKVLPFAAMLDKQQLARFKNEARAAATLDHPNIVAIHSVGVERGVHFYAMHLVEGESLAQVISRLRAERDAKNPPPLKGGVRGGTADADATIAYQSAMRNPQFEIPTAVAALSTLPEANSREYFRDIARLGIQAAEALDHAHANGILHRDVKPANLMVDDDGKLWITDFGLARIEADAGMTMTGDILGTLRYMSPEQALAKRVVVDHRSDIYSLGVTLYELVTLRPAYPASDRQELLRQIAFEEPRPPRQHDGRIPRDLETVVLKAMEKNPAQRYTTAHELADDLRSFLAHAPIKAKPPSWTDHVMKWSRRHPVAIRAALVGFLATACVLAASAGWISRDRTARQAILAQQVNLALEEARKSYDADRVMEAMSAVKRASAILAAGGGSDALNEPVAEWKRDLETVERLEQIRSETGNIALADTPAADRAYRKIFGGYGVDFESLDLERAARGIRTSPIRRQLLAALQDWYGQRESNGAMPTLESPRNKLLLQIANLADPDPWRTQLRQAIQRSDAAALKYFSQDQAILEQPPATVLLLAALINSWRGVFRASEGTIFLERGQRRYPDDFWINKTMGDWLSNEGQVEKAINYRRIAVALRPHSTIACKAFAYGLLQHGALEEAESAYREAIRLSPDDPSCYYQLEYVLRNLGKDVEADAVLQKAPPMRRDLPDTSWKEVLKILAAGKLDRAEDLARKRIRLAPAHATAHQDLAAILSMERKYRQAESALREALRLRPDDYFVHEHLGLFLYRQKKYEESEAIFRAALPLAPSSPDPYLNIGGALEWQGKYDEAESTFREALRLHDYADLHWGLGNVYIKRAEAEGENPPWEAAAEEFALAIDAMVDGPEWNSDRKMVCYDLARWNEAFEHVLKLRPAEPCLWIGRAQRHVFQSKWEAAAADYAHVIDTRLIHHELFDYAYLLVLQDDLKAYEQFCKEILVRAGQPKDAEEAYTLACVCTAAPCDAVAPAQVIEWAEQAAGRGNTEGWKVHALGMAYLRAGQYANAIKWFENSNRYTWHWDSQLARNWFGMAIAQGRLGHTAQARRCLEKGCELMEQARPLDVSLLHLTPVDWISMHVLRREAEALMERATGVHGSNTPSQPANDQNSNPES